MPTDPTTPSEVLAEVVRDVTELAKAKVASRRSSMPIYVDQVAVLLAAIENPAAFAALPKQKLDPGTQRMTDEGLATLLYTYTHVEDGECWYLHDSDRRGGRAMLRNPRPISARATLSASPIANPSLVTDAMPLPERLGLADATSDQVPDEDNVIKIHARGGLHLLATCGSCGDYWFKAMVSLNKDGTVNGRTTPVACSNCGSELAL